MYVYVCVCVCVRERERERERESEKERERERERAREICKGKQAPIISHLPTITGLADRLLAVAGAVSR